MRLLLLIFVSVLLFPSLSFAQDKQARILIFYSSTGMGHLSAAKAIEADIKEKDPTALVELKNIRDFKNPLVEKVDSAAFWYVVKNHPDYYTKRYKAFVENANQVSQLDEFGPDYRLSQLTKYIENFKPTTILSTHHGAAQTISSLRAKNLFRDTKIGWLHTDYMEAYFPRISKQVDKTFLAHRALASQWEQKDVPTEKIEVSGMPVNPKFLEKDKDRVAFREQFLKAHALNPNEKVIVISSGGEGVGDFSKIVQALSKINEEKIQIVAVCAKSKKNFNDLEKLKPELPPNMKLQVLKFIPQEDLLGYVRSADLYITKSGGLSPSEGFAINVPMILLDIYGGHEKENAIFFEKLDLALINRNYDDLTAQTRRVFSDDELKAQMSEAQLEFSNSINLRKVTDFALSDFVPEGMTYANLGVENGETVVGAEDALAKLDRDAPADIEILLSYGKYPEQLQSPLLSPLAKFEFVNNLLAKLPKSGLLDKEGNPFGHIALRIKDKVYTINGKAKPGIEEKTIHVTTLNEYLYGVTRNYQNEEHTDTFGEAYGRDIISLRVQGLTPEQTSAMEAKAQSLEQQWKLGTMRWNKSTYNCADFVFDLLKAGGLNVAGEIQRPTMPLDVFDNYVEQFEKDFDSRIEMVSYTRVADSANDFKISTYPASVRQLPRAFANMFLSRPDEAELRVSKRVTTYPGSRKVYYENINGLSADETKQREENLVADFKLRIANLQKQEQDLINLKAQQKLQDLKAEKVRESLTQLAQALSPADVESIKTGGPLDDLKNHRVQIFKRQFQEWQTLESQEQKLYDAIVIEELALLAEGMHFYTLSLYEDLQLRLKKEKLEPFKAAFSDLQHEFDSYKKNVDQYGKPKDGVLRTLPYRTFFAKTKTFIEDLNNLKDPATVSFAEKLASRNSSFKTVLQIASTVLGGTVRSFLSQTGVVAALNSIASQAGHDLGVDVEIQGEENIPDISNAPKAVTLFVPTHRDPILDLMIMGQLFEHVSDDGDMLLFAAPDQFLPKKLADFSENVDSFIVVGRGSDKPINKAIEQLNQGGPRSIFIYPEGSVSIGLGELRPPREKFAEGLIPRLQAAGYKVNIVPITYLNGVRMPYNAKMDSSLESLTEYKTLKVKIHKPLSPQSVELIQALGGNQAINLFIRGQWLEALDDAGVEGRRRLTLAEAQKKIEEDLKISDILPRCGELLRQVGALKATGGSRR